MAAWFHRCMGEVWAYYPHYTCRNLTRAPCSVLRVTPADIADCQDIGSFPIHGAQGAAILLARSSSQLWEQMHGEGRR